MRLLSATAKFAYGCGQLAWATKDTCFQFFLFFLLHPTARPSTQPGRTGSTIGPGS